MLAAMPRILKIGSEHARRERDQPIPRQKSERAGPPVGRPGAGLGLPPQMNAENYGNKKPAGTRPTSLQ
jgi:hypothetical protein